MNPNSINLSLVAKLLDRAGHPSTSDPEVLIAVRKAADHCKHLGLLGDTLLDLVNETNSALNPHAAFNADLVKEATKLETRVNQLTRNRDKWRAHCEIQRREHAAEIAERDARIEALEAAAAESASRNDVQLAEANERVAERDAEIVLLQEALTIAQQDVARAESAASTKTKTGADDDVAVGADVDGGDHVGEQPREMRWTRRAKARLAAYVSAGISKARIARLIATEFLAVVSAADISTMMWARWVRGPDGYLWAP